MTSFVFSSDDLMAAPAAVRQWLLARAEADLLKLAAATVPTPPAPTPALAACTFEEATHMLELLGPDFAATQVLIELARDTSVLAAGASLHAVSIASLMRHTRLDDGALISCLQAINRAFQEVRHDPQAKLFGFDQANHVYLHEMTYRSIHSLWEELVRIHVSTDAEPQRFSAMSNDLNPRQLGPSEDIVTHRAT